MDPLQRAVSCVTQAVLTNRGGYRPADEPHTLTFPEERISLRGESRLSLFVLQRYHLVHRPGDTDRGPWKVSVDAYSYSVDAADGREIFAYHWHPRESAITLPHLHIGRGAGTLRDELDKTHFPTGRVALEDVLRLLIRDFSVAPLRSDWATVLTQTQGRFEQYRTWPSSQQQPSDPPF
ncbi:MAG TPA: hypothetical protein VGW38_22185 [Chloroflexota bacterium]|nr:hypothetical protein [Chloroflexota bacterium]